MSSSSEVPSPSDRSPSPFPRIGAVLLTLTLLLPLLLLTPIAGRTLSRAFLALDLPTLQLDNEEGALLFQALELRAGRSIYRPLTGYPYFVGTYPPLYLAANAVLVEPDSPDLWSGRFLVLVSTFGITALLTLLIGVRTRNPLAALLAPVLFLATFETYNWIAYYRVDLPAVFLSLAGLSCITLAPDVRWMRTTSIVFFVLALYTKQTTVAAPAAAVLALFLADRCLGLRFFAVLAGAGLAVFLLLSLLTRGQFALHTVLYNMNTFHPEDLLRWGRHLWFLHARLLLAFVLVTGSVIWLLRRETPPVSASPPASESSPAPSRIALVFRRSPANPLFLYALFALLSAFSIGKAGTAENYLLEPLAAVILVTCDGLGWLIRRAAAGRKTAAALALAAAALLGAHSFYLSSPRLAGAIFSARPTGSDVAAAADVQRRVRSATGETWSELALFNIRAGRSMVFQPFILSELARQGRWDPAPFTDDLRRGRFSLLVTNRDLSQPPDQVYAPAILEAMRDGYTEAASPVHGRLRTYYLYRPRTRPY